MSESHSSTTVNADQAVPRWHVAHSQGGMSVQIADWPCLVYVHGSRSQIINWANAIRAEAIRGEEGE